MKKGIVAGGVALFIIGIIVFVPSNIINNVQNNNIQQCGTITGQLGQTLDQQNAQICNNATRYQSFASTGLIVGIIMLALGIVLILIGVLKSSTPKVIKEINK
jgi:beta-lactamase regulating signal transducer with metallopeptidase domain